MQGVSFRFYAAQAARQRRLKGFVKNEPDGTVYIEAEGEEKTLREFVQWCRAGSPWAQVTKIETSEGPLKNFRAFTIDR